MSEIKVLEVTPEQLGWKLQGKDHLGNVWITPEGKRHLFPKGQREVLLIRQG